MKALLAALLFAFCLLCPCAHAQQYEAARSRFLAVEAKAKQGDALDQLILGVCYEYGKGVEKNFVEAVKWYRKAAEQGEDDAQVALGKFYATGKGVEKDFVEGVKWFRKAAEQGDAGGQHMLGVCYANGTGVEKDFVAAYAWLNLASAADKDAAEGRDALDKKMSPQQVATAQKLTRELRGMIERPE